MSKPYWIELADKPVPTDADILRELERSRRLHARLERLWEPEGRPPAPAFRIEVTFKGAGE